MESKLIATILAVALVLATATIVTTQPAFAALPPNPGDGGGHNVHPVPECSNPNLSPEVHNKHCAQI
jgi:hypothetical protein